jgi:Ribbon-helix-helix protein, copG family.
MHRTQISLEDEQYELLVRESRRRGISLSAVIRELIRKELQTPDTDRDLLHSLAGIAEGTGEAVGRNHDRFLFQRNGKPRAKRGKRPVKPML